MRGPRAGIGVSIRFTLDTNLYVDALRLPDARDKAADFISVYTPSIWVSSVVAHELYAGVQGDSDVRVIDRTIVGPFKTRGRILTPTASTWRLAGMLVSKLRVQEGLNVARMRPSFRNDILLAASCRETGTTLITRNKRGFSKIQRYLDFDFLAPWPG